MASRVNYNGGMETSHLRRLLPAVGRLLNSPELGGVIRLYGRDAVKVQAQQEIDHLREQLSATPAAGEHTPEDVERLAAGLPGRIARRLESRLGAKLRRVVNATGIFVHTNLGRSPLPRSLAEELVPILSSYCDLEVDLESGRRSDRNVRAAQLLATLTGAEAAIVVNNNAAALVLALATLARGRQVVVSRGELVEIGGSFRIPDILAAAGAELVEVGTTNRTRIEDYEHAIGDDTAMLLKIHPSNYRITGFVAEVEAAPLVELGRRRQVPVMVDEGSGLLAPGTRPQLRDHPSLRELIAAGCDLVCGSGDKVLGGPQAGLIVGRRETVMRLARHPLYRALRPDRFTFAALEAVLRRALAGEPMPLARLWEDGDEHQRRLQRVAAELGAEIVAADAFIGGGSAPESPIPGHALAIPGDDRLLVRLRGGGASDPSADGPGADVVPVVGYLRAGRLILDLRTVAPDDDPHLVRAVRAARNL